MDNAATLAQLQKELSRLRKENAVLKNQLQACCIGDARLVEALLESTRSGIAFLDHEFRIQLVNRAFEQTLCLSREQLLGGNFFSFWPGSERKTIFSQVLKTGEPFSAYESPHKFENQPDRGTTYWDWSVAPVKKEDGSIEGLAISQMEVTEQVNLRERALEAERARARQAENFAAEVNHRVKNNLAIIAGLLYIQAEAEPAESRAAVIMRDAITRIRTLATVHEQLYETRGAGVGILEAVSRIVQINREALSAGDMEVSVEGDSVSYPAKTAGMLCLIANEIITNAIKHGGPGQNKRLNIHINVELREGKFCLLVWNSGNAIPADFDASRQMTLGLRLVREMVVDGQKGEFSLQPKDGGTLATICMADEKLREGES